MSKLKPSQPEAVKDTEMELSEKTSKYSLRELFEKIDGNSEFAKYRTNSHYFTADPDFTMLTALEILELSRDMPLREKIIISTFYNQPSRIAYMCDDIKQVKENLSNLRLPPYSQNKGELIFLGFKNYLENVDPNGPIFLEKEFEQRTEQNLEFILKKQLYVWRTNGPINGGFFSEYKN